MKVSESEVEFNSVSINATESAYLLLGTSSVWGGFWLRRWKRKGFHRRIRHLHPRVKFLSPVDDIEVLPFVLAVQEGEGVLNEYKSLHKVNDIESDAIDTNILDKIDSEALIVEEMWPPVELACHLGYADIVKHLLVEKRATTESKSTAVLLRAKQRAKALAAAA